MSSKTAKHTAPRSRRAGKKTERAIHAIEEAESLHLRLIGIRAAAAIAARAGDREIEIHLTRNVVQPLGRIIDAWETGQLRRHLAKAGQ